MEESAGGPPPPGDSAGSSSPPHRPRTVAEKLDRLFQVMSPKGRPYSYQQVADAINAKSSETGVTISHATIWQLRTGRWRDPRLSHLQGLADFFGVPLGYFTDEAVAAQVDDDLDLVAAMRDAGVRQVALRARGLSPRTLTAITTMIDAARSMEGLTEEGQDRGASGAAAAPPPDPAAPPVRGGSPDSAPDGDDA